MSGKPTHVVGGSGVETPAKPDLRGVGGETPLINTIKSVISEYIHRSMHPYDYSKSIADALSEKLGRLCYYWFDKFPFTLHKYTVFRGNDSLTVITQNAVDVVCCEEYTIEVKMIRVWVDVDTQHLKEYVIIPLEIKSVYVELNEEEE